MMSHKNKAKIEANPPFTFAIVFAAITTLYFNSKLQDPFNSPKQWILFISSAWLVGYLLPRRKNSQKNSEIRVLKLILSIFLALLFISALVTDNSYVAFFGETQRKLGFLTYFGFAIYMLIGTMFAHMNSLSKLYIANLLMGTILGSYGLLQHFGRDFVPWSNPYNRIIGTLGNPNFASSAMAIIASISFTTLFIKKFKHLFKLCNLILLFVLLFCINASDSIQGLVALSVGIASTIVVVAYRKGKGYGLASLLSFISIGFIAILGMLQIGPLTELLYKGSVTVRGYYWKAGFKMFQENPFFGIGVDRYGAYFKEYRQADYVLNYGFDISSSSAHNTFIQFFATSGVFVGVTFLVLNFYVFVQGIKLLIRVNQDDQLLVAGLLSAWLVFASQMFISIDNLGLTIWGWFIGGSIVGLSTRKSSVLVNNVSEEKLRVVSRAHTNSLVQPIVSGFLVLVAIILVSMLHRGEALSLEARESFNASNPQQSPRLSNAVSQVFNTKLIDPYYKFKAAELLAMSGETQAGLSVVEQLHNYDKRNQDYLLGLASLYDFKGDYALEIQIREKLIEYDPWNAKNYLELGRVHKMLGDLEKMEIYLEKILSFAEDTPEAEIATRELVR
jgi:O-antigen ligase